MHEEFEMSMMGELKFFLGLQIKQLEDDIFFNQSKYIKEMLKEFSLEDSKPIKTPMSSETKLTRDEDGEFVNDTKYHGMIGSLLYLTASQPDIMFSVCLWARFQEVPKTSHLEADELEYIEALDPYHDSELLKHELPMIREACLRVLILSIVFLKEAAGYAICLAAIGVIMSHEFHRCAEEPSEIEVATSYKGGKRIF
ncbi:retrovirus-related pol polyprotein from transposon TNT 1-94 [Tanacetum coccineum]